MPIKTPWLKNYHTLSVWIRTISSGPIYGVLKHRFQKQLLADKGWPSSFGWQVHGDEADKLSENPHLGDASSYQISAAYTAP